MFVRVRLLHQIAEGGFSYVYEGLDVSTGRQYAVKKVLCQTLDQKEEIRREISHHKRFKHPNLLPLIDYSVESSHTGYEYYLLFPLYQVCGSKSLSSICFNCARRKEL